MKNASTTPSAVAGVSTPPTPTPAFSAEIKPVEPVSQPMVPPVGLPNQTSPSSLSTPPTFSDTANTAAPSTPPAPTAPSGHHDSVKIADTKHDGLDSVKPIGGYAAVLSSKVNSDDDKPKENAFDKFKTDVIPTLAINQAKVDDKSGKGGSPKATKHNRRGKLFMTKVLGSIIGVAVLLAGLGAGYLLQTQDQGIQEQAYVSGNGTRYDIVPGKLQVRVTEDPACRALVEVGENKTCPNPLVGSGTNNVSVTSAKSYFKNIGNKDLTIKVLSSSNWCKEPYGQSTKIDNRDNTCWVVCFESGKTNPTETIILKPGEEKFVEVRRESDNKTSCGSYQLDWWVKEILEDGQPISGGSWSPDKVVSWTLCQTGTTCPAPPPKQSTQPQCGGFNMYKGDFASSEPNQPNSSALPEAITLSTGTTAGNTQGTLTDKFTVKQANGLKDNASVRPLKQSICWAPKGLAQAEYAKGNATFKCAVTCEVKNGTPTKGVNVGPIVVTCDTGTAAGSLRGGVTGSTNEFIDQLPSDTLKTQARTNGLIFANNVVSNDGTPALLCASNPYKTGGESGVLLPDGTPVDQGTVGSNCSRTAAGRNCMQTVNLASVEPAKACVGLTLNPASVPAGSTTAVTGTCTRVDWAKSYQVHMNGMLSLVAQPATGNASFTIRAPSGGFKEGSQNYTYSCIPCTTIPGQEVGPTDCAPIIPACTKTLQVTGVGGTPLACAGFKAEPAIVNYSAPNVTFTCTRVTGALSYKLSYPGTDGNPATQILPQPAGTANPTATFSNAAFLAAGTKTATCVPCSAAGGVGCIPDTAASCRATFTVQPPPGPACVSTAVAPPSITAGEAGTLTVTCGRVNHTSVLSYKLVVGTRAPQVLAQPASGNAVFSNIAKTGLTAATVISCVPCTDAAGTTCIANTAAQCKTTLTVNAAAENGALSCLAGNKKAFRQSNNQELTGTNPIVNRDEVIRYEITLTRANPTNDMKVDGIVRDTFNSAHMQYVPNSVTSTPAGVTWDTATYNIPNGILAFKVPKSIKSSTIKITYQLKVKDVGGAASISNTVTIPNNGQTAVGTSACTRTVSRVAVGTASCESKLAYRQNGTTTIASKTSTTAAGSVNKGEQFVYKITVAATQQTAGAVTITDTLPDKLEYVSQTGADNVAVAGNTLTFTLNAFGQGGTTTVPIKKVITVNVRAKAAATPGEFTNTVRVITNGDAATADTSCAHTAAIPPDGVASCTAKEMYTANGTNMGTLIADGTDLHTGSEFFYKVSVNASSQTAGKVIVTDELPAGIEFVDATGNENLTYVPSTGVVTKEYPTGFNGAQSFNFKVRLANSASGRVTNTAEVTTYNQSNQAVDGSNTACSVNLDVPRYTCDSACTSDAQCKTSNADYVCSSGKCRLEDNTSSTSCQAESFYCNKTCDSDSQCQTANTAYVCATTEDGKRCRLGTNSADHACQAAVTPTPTPTPTLGCNATCVNNADCSNPSHICHQGQCRLSTNVESTSCTVPLAQGQQPTPPTELPVTGPAEWGTWLKAGAVVLGIGALLLLLL